ncbi:hypothetical protein ACR3I8_17330 [Priestia flexa]
MGIISQVCSGITITIIPVINIMDRLQKMVLLTTVQLQALDIGQD